MSQFEVLLVSSAGNILHHHLFTLSIWGGKLREQNVMKWWSWGCGGSGNG